MELEGFIPGNDIPWDTVAEHMVRYVCQDYPTEEIQELAARITSGVSPQDRTSQMIAIRNWILANLQYVKDAPEAARLFGPISQFGAKDDLEMLKSPHVVLETGRYDCDCAVVLICSLLMALGIPARFTMVGFYPETEVGPEAFEHVYAEGLDEATGIWVVIDPVAYPDEKRMLADVRQSRVYDL